MPRDFKKKYPQIASEWNYYLNDTNPNLVNKKSKKKFFWKCSNKKCNHMWKSTIYSRIVLGKGCPKCSNRIRHKFPDNIKQVQEIFKKINTASIDIEKNINLFLNEENSRWKRNKSSVLIKKKLNVINKLQLDLRKKVLNYRKKIIGK